MSMSAEIRSGTLIIVAVLGVIFSLAGFVYSGSLERKLQEQEVERLLDHQRTRLEGKVDAVIEIVDAVASFVASPEQISRDDFARFTTPVLSRHPEIYSIQWIPRVSSQQRHEFELDLAVEGFTRGIAELIPHKSSLRTAEPRSEYFPILFAEPFSRNSSVIGFDVSTRPRNAGIMAQTLAQGTDFIASSPFRLVQDRLGAVTTILMRPVYQIGLPLNSATQRQTALMGYIVALIRPQSLLSQVHAGARNYSLLLDDISPEQPAMLGRAGPLLSDEGAIEDTFSVLSRQWRLQISVDPDQPLSGMARYQIALWVLLLGLLLTTFLVVLLRKLQRALSEAVAAGEHAQNYLDTVETILLALDVEGRITMINRKACELLGKPEQELLGQSWFSKRFMRDAALHAETYQQAMQHTRITPQHSDTEYAIRTVDDEDQIIAWHNALQFAPDGQVSGMLCAGINVTRQRFLQGLEHIQSQAMQSTLEGDSLKQVLEQVVKGIEHQKPHSLCSILLLDETGQFLHCGAAPSLPPAYNNAIEGLQIGDGIGSCGTAAYRQERVIVEDIQTHPYWAPFKDLAGAFNLASCWSEPIFGKKGRVLGTFAIYHSEPCAPTSSDLDMIRKTAAFVGLVVEEFQTEARLIRFANTDELTGMPNRRSLLERLEHELSRTQRYKQSMALCMLDIDHFKRINDNYGHEFGDQVLRQLSNTMTDMMRETDLAGRIGGEEFAVILPGADHEQAGLAAERIREAVEQLLLVTEAGTPVRFTVSIGVAVIDGYSPTAIESSQVLSVADRCLYSAKRSGRNQISFIPAVLEPVQDSDQS